MRYCLLNALGIGAFGTVYRARERNTNRVFAVKVLVRREEPWDVALALAYRGEGEILPKLNHSHIIRCFYSHGWGTPRVEIVLTLMDGTLSSLAESPILPRPLLAKHALHQMLQALDYLSQLGYVHRDVKPDNIFYTILPPSRSGPQQPKHHHHHPSTATTNNSNSTMLLPPPPPPPLHFRLGDFGLCEHEAFIEPGEVRGTMLYMAPELFDEDPGRRGRPRPWQRQTHKSDVWALYVTVLWVLDLDGIWRVARRGECSSEGVGFTFTRNLAARVVVDEERVGALREMARVDPWDRVAAGEVLRGLFGGYGGGGGVPGGWVEELE
ncbi:kinase-like domain-containing protein [Parachaetomium inaequale]|uniref:Kinase-like domain-containing protein n=1 Tax=Parachaetomium inaequale TaxID=2588326 RepID=A0AAN6PD49_9PEZI|nr:kinase-like domain-containing protein [Parachaetomium inaequale]